MSRENRRLKRKRKDPIKQFAKQVVGHGQNQHKKSLGTLWKHTKTKPRSPDVTGKLSLQHHTLAAIVREIAETGGEEVICNIAGWMNQNQHGEYLTVEISPQFLPHKQQSPKRGVFTFLGDDNQDE
jgi:hypothetical protein